MGKISLGSLVVLLSCLLYPGTTDSQEYVAINKKKWNNLLSRAFRWKDCTNHVELVKAVQWSKYPELMLELALEESDGKRTARSRMGAIGAFQVIPRYHGAVPSSLTEQRIQSEHVLLPLLGRYGIRKALAMYNGGNTPPRESYRYADRIIKRIKA